MTIEFPKPTGTIFSITDEEWSKAVVLYREELIPFLETSPVTLEKVVPDDSTHYFACRYKQRHFALSVTVNVRHLDLGLKYLPQVDQKVAELLASGIRDPFYSEIDLWTKGITKGEGRHMVYHFICDFLREAGVRIWTE